MEQQIKQVDPMEGNLVSSYEVGLISYKKNYMGMCIKFAMYDKTTKLMHWTPQAVKALIDALTEYVNFIGFNAFMFRAKADPTLVADLPERHPYHTVLSEKPSLTTDEIATAGRATSVGDYQFAIRGPTFTIRVTYLDKRFEEINLHEYTAFELCGYLQHYLKAADMIRRPAEGNA